MTNKNSIYLGALTSFILDTKPYHSKLTEVQEVYQFADTVSVKIEERFTPNVLTKAAWMYSYFSGGIPQISANVGQPMSLHQLTNPLVRGYSRNSDPTNSRGAFKAFRDENLDLPMVPFAFDPKCLGDVGLSDAFVQRNGLIARDEPITEGLDVFLTHGAFVFQVKQATSTQPLVVGRFEDTYELTDAPFPKTVNLPFTNADSLVIVAGEGNATQLTLSSIRISGPGKVVVFGLSAAPNYAPQYTERKNENLLAVASASSLELALDTVNPLSAVNQLIGILNDITSWLVIHPNANATAAIIALQATLAIPAMPTSYEALFQALVLGGTPVLTGYTGWVGQDATAPYDDLYVDQAIAALSPGLAMGMYSDLAQRESGKLQYNDLTQGILTISNVIADPIRVDYEEFTLEAINPDVLAIRGSSTGTIGAVLVGDTFSSTALGFSTALISPVISATAVTVGQNYKIIAAGTTNFELMGAESSDPDTMFEATTVGTGTGTVQQLLNVGDEFVLTPLAKVTVHYQAPLEAWSVISINPRAYSRPFLTSTRYGYIRSLSNVKGFVTILDNTIPSTTLVLTANSASSFTMTSTADPAYIRAVTVNTLFNDGKVGFTVVGGTAYSFAAGDKFYIEIQNDAPVALDLDLFYGYDTEPYDADTMVYNSISSALTNYLQKIGFGYDSRFVGYDVAGLGMVMSEAAVDGRTWRLRALPNLSSPLNLQNAHSPNPVNQVSVIATNSPTNPAAAVLYDMANNTTSEGVQSGNDPDTIADLLLYYATSFALEYYDTGTETWVNVGTVPVGSTYTNATHGFTFKIQQGSKPFISGILNTSWYPATTGTFSTEVTTSGDIISWTVHNNLPFQTEGSGLTSRRAPRLIMYGEDFYESPAAKWTLTWISSTTYRLQGTYTSGLQNGQAVFTAPGITINTSSDGRSYKNSTMHLHYTVVTGSSGMTAGDSLSFETYVKEPTFLIHGSVSGWQPDAIIDQWYWNGKIGFKIPRAKIYRFDPVDGTPFGEGPWAVSNGTITCTRLRPDTPTSSYTVTCNTAGHWMLFRDGALVSDGTTSVSDLYLTLALPTAVVDVTYRFGVRGHDYAMAEGHDLAIIKTSAGRSPTANDFVLLERTTADHLQISIQPKDTAHGQVLDALAPVVTDLRFVDHNANSNVPLSATSPETAVLTGWFGITETKLDSTTSTAEFSDPLKTVVVRATATGETVGVVSSLGTTAAEPVIFRWDPAFHAKYLPLNAQATVVTLGSGMNEAVHVNMHDAAMFLLGGGGLSTEAFFTDVAQVAFVENGHQWAMNFSYGDDVGAAVADTGFTGFLPGYDNVPMDFELGVGDVNSEAAASGYYDAGVPLTEYFLQAQSLALLPSMTPQQQALFNDLTNVLFPYLDGGDVITTTMVEFLANVGASTTVPVFNNIVNWTGTTNGFGIPDVGMGMDIGETPVNTVGTAFDESLAILAIDQAYTFSVGTYGQGGYDAAFSDTIFVTSPTLPPSPVSGLPSVGTTYANYNAAMEIGLPGAHNIEVSFLSALLNTPNFYIWRPTDVSPMVVSVVERLTDRAFRFSVPVGGEMKLIAIPNLYYNPADANVKLLLHGEGTVGTGTYIDSSSYNRTMAATSSVVVLSTAQHYRGLSSLNVIGNVNFSTPALTTNEWLSMGTTANPLTIEMAVQVAAGNPGGVLAGNPALTGGNFGWWKFTLATDVGVGTPTPRIILAYNGGTAFVPLTGWTHGTGTWHMIAIAMRGTTNYEFGVWMDGVWKGSATLANPIVTPFGPIDSELNLTRSQGNDQFLGYLDEVRISNELFLPWGSNYTLWPSEFPNPPVPVPTALALWHAEDLLDSTANNVDITSGNATVSAVDKKFGTNSFFFNSTYLLAPSNAALNLGTGDFTVEAFVKHQTGTSGFGGIISANSGSSRVYLFVQGPTQALGFGGDTMPDFSTAANTLTANVWHHVAVTRQGTTLRLFVDGILGNTATCGVTALANFSAGGTLIGTANVGFGTAPPVNANQAYVGYIDEVRVVGSCLYAANFVPPTIPFTAV